MAASTTIESLSSRDPLDNSTAKNSSMICDPAEKQAMVVEFMPLVRRVVSRICLGHHYQQCDIDDMISDGTIGLMDAIDKFEPERGNKFATYATRRIWGEIQDGWRDRDWVPRLVRQRKQEPVCTVSIDSNAYTEDVRTGYRNYSYAQFLEDPHAGKSGSQLEAADSIDKLLKGIGQHERFAMQLYYVDGLTMREIGQTIGLSESRVSQMISQSLTILKAKLTPAA